MFFKKSKLKSVRKEQKDLYDKLKLSDIDVAQIVNMLLQHYRKINEANTTRLLDKLFADYFDNSEVMSQIMPSNLPGYVKERHVVTKTKDGQVVVEFNYIENKLANCRINIVCDNPKELEQILSKRFDAYGEEISDPRISHYSFCRVNNDEGILYGSYTNKSFKDMLYIHLTAMEYSGL